MTKQDSTWNVDIDFVGPNGFKNAVSHATDYGELKTRAFTRRLMTDHDLIWNFDIDFMAPIAWNRAVSNIKLPC